MVARAPAVADRRPPRTFGQISVTESRMDDAETEEAEVEEDVALPILLADGRRPRTAQTAGRGRAAEPASEPEQVDRERDRSPTRLKRSHHKVRTGCVTCRRRRVKCDETRPRCSRCAKAGRLCEGYTQSKAWLFEPAPNELPAQTSGALSSSLTTTNPIHFFVEPDLNRPTQYFLECTGPRIALYFAEMMDSFVDNKALVTYSARASWGFWTRLVVQASQAHECVRHSLAAVSSLHEWLELTKRTPWQNYLFNLYYTKAITEINQTQGSLPLDIMLISCVLFAHCDFLMGASAAGLAHLKSGYRIISENRERDVPIPTEVSEFIEPIIRGFIAKSDNYMLREDTDPSANLTENATYGLPEMPEVFQDLTQANKTLQKAVYWVLLLELGQPNHLAKMAPAVRKHVAEWATAFGRWKASLEIEDACLKDWQLLLLAHHRMALLILRSLPPENDRNYSRAAADFRVMFAQLRTFMRGGHIDPNHGQTTPVLNFHLGLIAPLFFIATQCRVRDIRRNALDALRDLKVVEGHWNSCVAYVVAKAVATVEERFLEASESRVNRIKVDCVDRAKDGTLVMRYRKIPGNGTHDDVTTRTIAESCCHHEVSMQWPVVRVVQLHGFQAAVTPRTLDCSCHDI